LSFFAYHSREGGNTNTGENKMLREQPKSRKEAERKKKGVYY
jgi:hypothetical protein